jgi:signal transduction histidine kinase
LIQDELYRTGRDVLRNAFHHARAMRIEVEVLYGARAFRLRIRDNGIGIGQKVLVQDARLGNWGSPGVRERAKPVGVKLNSWSEAGAGAEVQVTVPAAIAYEKSRAVRASRFFQSYAD